VMATSRPDQCIMRVCESPRSGSCVVRASPLRTSTHGVCFALLIVAGCGGARASSAKLTAPPVVSLTRIVKKFQLVRSYGSVETTIALLPAPIGRRITFKTFARSDLLAKRSAYTTSQSGSPSVSDVVVDGSRQYYRERGPGAFAGSRWCSVPGVKRAPGPDVVLTDPVAALAGSNRHAQVVGTESVRGVETTHYRVTGEGPPVQIWVDAQDQLRRLQWTPGGHFKTQTTDFFNFDQPVTITVPMNTRPCSSYPNTP
jgi:hypothetical protein